MYRVNLLPDYLQSRRQFEYNIRKILIAVGCVFTLALIMCYVIFLYQLNSAKSQLARNESELAQLQPMVTGIQRVNVETQLKQDKYNALLQIIDNRLTWHRMLQELPLALPMDTWINRIEIKKVEKPPESGGFTSPGYRPGIKGNAVEAEAEKKENSSEIIGSKEGSLQRQPESPPVPNMVYFYGTCWAAGSVGVVVDNLSRLPYFDYIKLVEVGRHRTDHTVRFEISARIKGGEWDVRENPNSQP